MKIARRNLVPPDKNNISIYAINYEYRLIWYMQSRPQPWLPFFFFCSLLLVHTFGLQGTTATTFFGGERPNCQKQNKAFCRITRVYSCTRQWFYCGPVKKVMIWLSVQFAAQTFSHSENVKWQPVSQICHWEQQAIASDWSEWQQWLTRAKADWHNHICRGLEISFIIIFPSLHHTWHLSLTPPTT